MGILICGLNGSGKSTIGRKLAERMSCEFIDIEDLYFPNKNSSYVYSKPRSKEKVIQLLEKTVSRNDNFVFAAVKGDYGEALRCSLNLVVLIEVPRSIRLKRIYDRSFSKFGERILYGGDLFEQENAFFDLVRSRSENYVTRWLRSVDCTIIKIDGTRDIDENVELILSKYSKGGFYV